MNRILKAVAVVVVLSLVSCDVVGKVVEQLPPIEVCYVHPRYGQVCVKADGKLFISAHLTAEQKDEVLRWVIDHPEGR